MEDKPKLKPEKEFWRNLSRRLPLERSLRLLLLQSYYEYADCASQKHIQKHTFAAYQLKIDLMTTYPHWPNNTMWSGSLWVDQCDIKIQSKRDACTTDRSILICCLLANLCDVHGARRSTTEIEKLEKWRMLRSSGTLVNNWRSYSSLLLFCLGARRCVNAERLMHTKAQEVDHIQSREAQIKISGKIRDTNIHFDITCRQYIGYQQKVYLDLFLFFHMHFLGLS